ELVLDDTVPEIRGILDDDKTAFDKNILVTAPSLNKLIFKSQMEQGFPTVSVQRWRALVERVTGLRHLEIHFGQRIFDHQKWWRVEDASGYLAAAGELTSPRCEHLEITGYGPALTWSIINQR